jgi:hypothetical protein
MNFARISLLFAIASVLTACSGSGTGAGGGSGSIQLTPNGTAAKPYYESISTPFLLSATDSGYAGNYTAVKISGQCFKVEPPATSPGYWTVAPGGGLCIGGNQGDVEEFQVTDAQGRSAVTYITTKI